MLHQTYFLPARMMQCNECDYDVLNRITFALLYANIVPRPWLTVKMNMLNTINGSQSAVGHTDSCSASFFSVYKPVEDYC